MFEHNESFQGGYYNSSNNFDSPSGAKQNKPAGNKRDQNVVAVTIQQVLTSPNTGIKIGEHDVNLVSICGLVKSVNVDSVKVTYHVADHTGGISAIQWIESDGEEAESPTMVENTYCHIYGSFRTQQDTKTIIIFKIAPLEDLNELTVHLLEIVHCYTMMTSTKKAESSMQMEVDSNLSNSLMTTNNFSAKVSSGFNTAQQKVFDVVKASADPTGVSRASITKALAGQLTPKVINDILQFMCGEGHIYSTIDDDHFQTTD